VSRPLPGLDFNGKTVIGSKEALQLADAAKVVVIIWRRCDRREFAYFFQRLGTKVTIIECFRTYCRSKDTEVSQNPEKSFAKQGITASVITRRRRPK